MSRERSTLFAPSVLSNSGGFELLPMPPDIQAIYDAGQRSTPYSADVDEALAAHRQAYGEPEQIQLALCVDPCDAMPSHPAERYRAYVSQRRYAVRAGVNAGMAPAAIAQALGVSVHTIRSDLATMRLRHQRLPSPSLAKFSPSEIQGLLDQGLTQGKLAKRLGVSHQAVSQFCLANGLTNPAHARRRKKIAERQKMVRLLSAKGL
ncbi:helix-turn-helix domain-containing protein [Stenotrophomonas bentonitica]|uniref:helix-turn-helix domain-containing protein n=1 Tax=Stenotrophomonas bentonitica TaxID=1450134 RepID=UPI0031BAF4E8